LTWAFRAFNKAETDKEASRFNEAKRTARLTRRRLSRRASRLKGLRKLFKEEGLNLTVESCPTGGNHQVASWLWEHPLFQSHRQSPWILRVEGLSRKLEDAEWESVIFHICKHRGFHWVSRDEQLKEGAANNSEGGKS